MIKKKKNDNRFQKRPENSSVVSVKSERKNKKLFTEISLSNKNIFQEQSVNKIHHQQNRTTENFKGSSLGRRKVTPSGNLDLHKSMKSTKYSKYGSKYKMLVFPKFKVPLKDN